MYILQRPQARKLVRRDPRIDSGRKPQAYIFDQGRKPASMRKKIAKGRKLVRRDPRIDSGRKPASMRKKIAKGRKLSGARTGSYKAARPQGLLHP